MPSLRYNGRSLALLVPTMNRPDKMRNLLESIAGQTVVCGRIVVVDGGSSVREVVMGFADRLPVEHYICQPPGQIRQRNMGIGLLDERTPLVGCLDDDIVLLPAALEKMMECWNRCSSNTAGISFNIVNMPAEGHNWLKGLIGMSGPEPGRVLRSGRNTPIVSMATDRQVEWLCGGATVWKLEILKQHTNREAQARWAPLEDLIFSYPIGKLHPLHVCAAAQVRHEHVYDHNIKRKHAYYGRTETLWKFYFVESHEELSRMRFLILQFSTVAARLLMALVTFDTRHLQFALGQFQGLFLGLKSLFLGRSLFALLNEPLPTGETKAKRHTA